ncbi:hypothetical protein AX14_008311 [Amanita brunnescens Koide BX004]|nr:hypothetical protein AX14_008311 [Amanita brunnescens Koide BX004]
MPRSYRPRNIACQYPGCTKLFANQAGLKIHLRSKHYRQERFLRQQCTVNNNNRDSWDSFSRGSASPTAPGSPNQQASMPDSPCDRDRNLYEEEQIHNVINGRPCNQDGVYLPSNTPPPPWEERAPDDFTPFDSRASFKLANLLYSQVQMSEGNISELMEIIREWVQTQFDAEAEPPFTDAKDMYATIDESELGHIGWQSFSLSYDGAEEENSNSNSAPWKRKSFDVWFRDPRELLKAQLGNRDFGEEMDFAPKEVRNKEMKARVYRDFMSGAWAWRQ